MIKGIVLTIIVLMGIFDYALIVASSTADKDAHEAYERWKESKKNERSD